MTLSSSVSFVNANKLFFVVAFVSFILCFFNIYGYPIYILDEAKNAEAAREMLAKANFLVPTFNNVLRTDKPPLHYFFMMLGYKLFGVTPLGARFFSSVFGALTILSTFYFVKKFKGKQTALVTVGILISAVFFIQEFHLSVPDPYLIFFINLGLFSFLSFYRFKKTSMLVLMYVAVAFGFLAKGPIALGIIGLSCLLFLIFRKELSLASIWRFKPLLGLVLVLIIVFPWFYGVHVATNGAWTEGFFIGHNMNRFENKMEGHGGPFVITWLFVLLGLLPFSVFILQAFYYAVKQRKKDVFVLFALCVSIVVIGFFSISGTKLPNYTMPCYPILAGLIASYFVDFEKKFSLRRKMFMHISFIVLLIIGVALPVGGYIALSAEKALQHLSSLSFILVILPIGLGIAYLFFRANKFKDSFAIVVGTWVVLSVFLFGIIYPRLLKENPAYMAKNVLRTNVPIVVFKRMDSAFPFNYNRTYTIVTSPEELLIYLNKYKHTYVLTNDKHAKEDLAAIEDLHIVLEQKALFENHCTVIFEKNEP